VGESKALPDSLPTFSPDGSAALFGVFGKWSEDSRFRAYELWKLTLPDLRAEQVQKTYSGNVFMAFPSDGAKQIADLYYDITLKVSLIENLFGE
jgi:hypothetical protein